MVANLTKTLVHCSEDGRVGTLEKQLSALLEHVVIYCIKLKSEWHM